MQIRYVAHPLLGLILLWMFIVGIHGASPALAAQDTATVQVIGTSRVRSQDMQATREEAVNAGLIAAVGRAAIDIVPQGMLAGRFAALTETILAHTDRYVRDYRVLTEATQANIYHVLLEATVVIPQLKAALKQAGLAPERTAPRLLICMAEKRIEEITERYWWSGQTLPEDILAGSILSQQAAVQGYQLIDPQTGGTGSGFAADLTVPEALGLAGQLGADLVIVGRATAEEAPNTIAGSLKAFRGSLAASAYRVATGELVARVEKTVLTGGSEPETGGHDALVKVAGLAADALLEQIGSAGAGTTTERRIELAVEGTRGNIADFVRFRNTLSAMPGVDNVQLKEIMRDRALISIDYQADTRALADALLLQNYESFGISIQEIGPLSIRLQLQPQ